MAKRAIYEVIVDGKSINEVLNPRLLSLTVSDKAGTTSDTCTIVIDNTDGRVALPRENAKVEVSIGWFGGELADVFSGNVDTIRTSGSRAGRTITVQAKGLDTSGKVKEPQRRSFQNLTIKEILEAAGSFAGVTRILVDPELGVLRRISEVMDNESFVALGERLAREIGGTFKVRNDAAVMAKRGSGKSPAGDDLPDVPVTNGVNLHEWEVDPYVGRHRYKKVVVRYYDQAAAEHKEVVVETDVEGSDAEAIGTFTAATKELAEQKAEAVKKSSERQSGAGRVVIEGAPGAQPEAAAVLNGTDIDGRFRIDGVQHQISKGSGFVTTLTLRNKLPE